MSALFTSLASVADQYGQAKNAAQQEKQARADKLRSMDVQDAYLQISKQAEQRQQEAHQQAMATGNLLKIGNRLWDVKQGKFVDMPQQENPLASLKEYIASAPPEEQVELARVGKMTAEADPGNPEKAIQAVLARHKDLKAEADRRADATQRETDRRTDAATSETHRREDRASFRQEIEAFERSMVPYRLQQTQESKSKELTPAATKIVETTMPTLQQVDRLLGDIDRLNLGTNNQAGYLLGPRLKYAIGMASPEGTLADDIAGLSLGSVVEAGSAMQGTSRSMMALKKALVHTPNPWKDSPMLMKRKLTEIRQRLQDMVSDAQKYGAKGATPTGAAAAADPLGVLQ